MRFIAVLALGLLVAACVPENKPIITETSLQTQAMQTREFDAPKNASFAASVSVLQDLGYNIGSADLATGFVTGRGPVSSSFVLFVGTVRSFATVTAFVEQINDERSRVRLNFVNEQETSSGYGMRGGSSEPIEDPEVYQKAFEQIKKAVFVRTNT